MYWNKKTLPDINEIGSFVYEWNFDMDDYNEYLQDNELEHSQQSYDDYIKENVEFYIEFTDCDTFRTFETASLTYEEIAEKYGDAVANTILEDCITNGSGSLDRGLIGDDEVDLDNPAEVNKAAKNVLRYGQYTKNVRGFILTDGTVVYTPVEHRQCTQINGVKGTFHFIKMGNIRVLQNSIDIGKEPTNEQYNVLRNVIASYAGETLYLTIINDTDGEIDVTYTNPDWRFVINAIRQYYYSGIKPTNRTFYEGVKKRRTALSENSLRRIVRRVINELL